MVVHVADCAEGAALSSVVDVRLRGGWAGRPSPRHGGKASGMGRVAETRACACVCIQSQTQKRRTRDACSRMPDPMCLRPTDRR